ncbi:MAG TPA: hypothetical protein VNK96_06520 [Fimbriimonadales bacterium]|nr:hypothetical protein [Fimbriimonadales bacterium]
MKLSRRDIIKTAGAVALAGTFPKLLSTKASAAANASAETDPIFAVQGFGADVAPWCFDKSLKKRLWQILFLKRLGLNRARINDPLGGTDQGYDIYHAAAVFEECLEHGIMYTISGVCFNPGVESLVTETQFNALWNYYSVVDGNVLSNTRGGICAIGIGLNIPTIRDFLLNQIAYMRSIFPVGVRMQCWNGPEMDNLGWGFGLWNLFDPAFQQFVFSLGFSFDNVDMSGGWGSEKLKQSVQANFDSFVVQAKAIWGEPFYGTSNHTYWRWGPEFGINIYISPWQLESWTPHHTEFGINKKDIPIRKDYFYNAPFELIKKYAKKGKEFTDQDGKWNIKEINIHQGIDSRFRDLWTKGDTSPLWNPRLYQKLLDEEKKKGSERGEWDPYTGSFMEVGCAFAYARAIRELKTQYSFDGITDKELYAYIHSDSMDLPK